MKKVLQSVGRWTLVSICAIGSFFEAGFVTGRNLVGLRDE
jgi:hypothetical protein